MHLPHRLFLLLTGLIWGIAACTAPAEPAKPKTKGEQLSLF